MRILTIRGEGLASLADIFCVDLTVEPLRSAGLFAITGPTGAGKSTILDAMCLALYGTCPKMTKSGVDDNIVDLSGDRLKSSDPRAILRPGITTAWAEVDFEAMDGRSYRARWTARRARGNAEGRLQPVERSLHDIEQDRLIENGITQVNQRVSQLSGLSYDEFRRTVLLPQGDFDAFLQANTGERAAILEKVTGTDIYRRISRAIYARADLVRSGLSNLQTRLGEHEIMTDAERDELLQQVDTLRKEQVGRQQAMVQLAESAQRHKDIADAEGRLHLAEKASEAAQSAHDEMQRDRDLLTMLEAAEPLRADWKLLGTSRASQAAANDRCSAAKAAAELQAQRAAIAKTEQYNLADKLDQVDAAIDGFEAQWLDAARLDEQIVGAESTLAGHDERLSRLHAERQEVDANSTILNAKIDTLRGSQAKIADNMAQRSAIGTLSKAWGEVSSLLDQHAGITPRLVSASARLKTAGQKVDEASVKIDAKRAELAEAVAKFETLDESNQKLAAQIMTLASANPEERREAVIADLMILPEVKRMSMAAVEAKAEIGIQRVRLQEAASRIKAATSDRDLRRQDLDRVRATVALLEAPAARAEAALSEAASHLRAHLEEGQPCPVCHATEHPVQNDAALEAVASELRRSLATARDELSQHEAALEALRVSIAAAEHETEAASEKIERNEKVLDAAIRGYADIHGSLPTLPSEVELVGAPSEALEKALREEKTQLDAVLQEVRKSTKALEGGRIEAEQLKQRQALVEKALGDLEGDRANGEVERNHARETQDQCYSELSAVEAKLMPYVEGIGMTCEHLRGDGVSGKLAKLNAWWLDLERQQAEGRAQIDKLTPGLAACAERLRLAMSNIEEAQSQREEALIILERLRQTRSGLLGGESTSSHKAGWVLQRVEVRRKNALAVTAYSEARELHAKAVERLAAAQDEFTSACRSYEEAQRALESGLSRIGIAQSSLEMAMATGPEKTSALREKLTVAERNLQTARSLSASRRADLDQVLQSGIPAQTLDDIQGAIAAHQLRQKEAAEEIGAVHSRIASDDAARLRMSGLEKELQQARGDTETWDAVNAAVGQANGNRFAQFAQSVTLGVLIERANIQMQILRPRYRLDHGGEDLSIQVIDDDMGGERRSANSLSGGERFLVSLSLALALAGMGGNGGLAGTLFIDEGFGTLDRVSLDTALEGLERLQSQGRTVGIISHVDAMKERIPVKVEVRWRGAGRSTVRTVAA